MRNSTYNFLLRAALLIALTLGLVACGGESSGDAGSTASSSQTASPSQIAGTTTSDVVFSGSVGDGPVTGATVTVYSVNGAVLNTSVSDNQANYRLRVKAKGKDYPLRLEASGGIDLVTGKAPDFRMVSVMAHPSIKTANINPFTTLIVQVAEQLPDGLGAGNVRTAKTLVMDALSFGLDSNRVPDPVTSVITDSNVAHIVKASEALGEVIRRTRDHMAAIGQRLDGDAVMAALASDMADGVLDGHGRNATDARITAVANVVSGQVLVEALSNNLRVGGMVATTVLDQSIISTHPGLSTTELSGNVRITAGMLQQARAAVAAARVLDVSAPLAYIVSAIDGLSANATAASVETVLPAGISLALSGVVGMVAYASPAEINAVNNVIATGESPDQQNIPPSISGTPAKSVVAGNAYSFRPTASDTNADTLNFSISGRPAWASFNTWTGRLSGTPTQSGTHSNIVISVTDGTASVSLPAFSVRVDPAPVVNTPPSISGTPAKSVVAGNAYSFRPTASDTNADTLTFSISNKPSWASFNSGTGRLSGTPTQSGTHSNIVISVTDGTASVSLPAFSVRVDPAPVVNTPPSISGTPAKSVVAGNAYSFRPTASDANADTLTFSISNKPSWASFNSGTGRLSGTPTQSGSHGNIVISVWDGTASVSLPAFSVRVDPAPVVNTPPSISGTPAKSVVAGNAYSFRPTASDANADTLTFSISNKPSWASFNSGTGRLSGTPTQSGSHGNIVISVWDGTASVSLPAFSVRVDPAPVVNTPPSISGTPAKSVVAGNAYSFRPTASDANADTLTFSISNKPSWASFNSGTGRLSGTPTQTGSHGNIVISVWDGTASVSLPAFSVRVDPAPVVNTPPSISGTPAKSVVAGNAYSFRPTASDANADTLTFSISNKPSWASFNSGTGRLSGTPTQTGSHGNIVISVTDGTDTVSLPAFTIQVNASTGSFSLSWTAPTTRSDGTPIALSEIDGYRVYYGTTPGNYPNSVDITNGAATATTVNNIPVGDYSVVMTTYDTSGMESAQSGAVSKQAR